MIDAVVGNPPWDRIKLQQVEWFAARRPRIALAAGASNRIKLIAKLKGVRLKSLDQQPLQRRRDKSAA